ncbi:hypothetical protein, partial [Stenotrophomonas maltophilia]|uniref:hypothetical protein n=1 Tax=Stenotrophomonas maltophilia TaxID=40324 RepID=UPI001952D3C8
LGVFRIAFGLVDTDRRQCRAHIRLRALCRAPPLIIEPAYEKPVMARSAAPQAAPSSPGFSLAGAFITKSSATKIEFDLDHSRP